MRIVLPWPAKDLSPNQRLHWSKVAKAKKAYRALCAGIALEAGLRKSSAEKVHMAVTFHEPDKRRRDMDNMIAAMKSGFDGLADVLGIDDHKWSFEFHRSDTIGGMVVIEVNA